MQSIHVAALAQVKLLANSTRVKVRLSTGFRKHVSSKLQFGGDASPTIYKQLVATSTSSCQPTASPTRVAGATSGTKPILWAIQNTNLQLVDLVLGGLSGQMGKQQCNGTLPNDLDCCRNGAGPTSALGCWLAASPN